MSKGSVKNKRFVPRVAAVTAVTLLVLTAGVPVTGAQGDVDESKGKTSFVTFYGHIFGMGRDGPMPMNVEYPWGEEDLSQGFLMGTCGNPAEATCADSDLNEVWFYSTAGFVDVSDAEDFSYERIHNERGLTKDTFLDTTKDIVATFYMSADMHGWPIALCSLRGVKPYDVPEPLPCWNWDPGYLPQWTVEATVFAGVLGEYGGEANTGPNVAQAYESGALEVIAQGKSTPQDITSLEAAGSPTVWKFDVNLGTAQTDVIPKEKSYLVRFKFWSETPAGPAILSSDWNVNSGEFYPPSITIPVKNAFDVESVIPQFVHDKLVILGILNTPWGSYDVAQESVTLEIMDAKNNEVEPVRIEKLADFSVAHGGHYKPVNITYVWDYKADKLKAGEYTATVTASNYQKSATGSCTGTFTILEGGAPGTIEIGECAVRTLTAEQLGAIQSGVGDDAAGKGRGAPEAPAATPGFLPADVPDLGVASAGVTPVAALGVAPLLAAFALAFVVGLVGRRWSS